MKKWISWAAILCLLLNTFVFAETEDSYSSEISASAASVVYNTSTEKLSNGSVIVNQNNMGGQGIRANAYQLTDVYETHTATTSRSRLYLQFDLSAYQNWDIEEATLNLQIMCTASGAASTVNIYKADAIEGDFSNIAGAYRGNYDGLKAIATDENRLDRFTVRANYATATYKTDYGTPAKRNFLGYIRERVEAGETKATILIEFVAGKDNTAYVAYVAAPGTGDYAPTLLVTGAPASFDSNKSLKSKAALVSYNTSTEKLSNGSVIVNQNNMGGQGISANAYIISDVNETHTATTSRSRLYLQFDLSACKNWDIEEATLNLQIMCTASGAASTVNIYKADAIEDDFSNIAGAYSENYSGLKAIATDENRLDRFTVRAVYTTATYKTDYGTPANRNFLGYIRERISAGETKATILIEFVAGKDNSAYKAYIAAPGSKYEPTIDVVAKDTLSTTSNSVNIKPNKEINIGTAKKDITVEDVEYSAGDNFQINAQNEFLVISDGGENYKESAFIRMNINDIKDYNIISAKLKFLQFYDEPGTLKIYEVDCGDNWADNNAFLQNYPTGNDLPSFSDLIATFAYSDLANGSSNEFYASANVKNSIIRALNNGKDYIDLKFEYTGNGLKIRNEGTELCPYLEIEYGDLPYNVSATITQYKPWIKNYHITTNMNVARGGEGCEVPASIEVSPCDPNLLMLGNVSSGVWRSADGGKNWYSVNDGINMWAGLDFEFHPKKANVVFMVQGEPNTSDNSLSNITKHDYAGIYKSTDGGKSFTQVLSEIVFAPERADKLIQFDGEGNVYVLSSMGVFKSTDEGDTWSCIKAFDEFGEVYDLAVSEDGLEILYADENTGLNISFDGGNTWENKFSDVYSVEFSPLDSSCIYIVRSGEYKGLYKSIDNAENWTEISGIPSSSGFPAIVKIAMHEESIRIYLIYQYQGSGVWYSDNETSWIRPNVDDSLSVNPGNGGNACAALAFDKTHPSTVYYAYADCVYKSKDYGTSFTWKNSGYSASRVDDFVIDEDGRLWIAAMDYGLFRTTSSYVDSSYPRMISYLDKTGRNGSHRSVAAIGINPRNKNEMIISLGGQDENQLLKKTTDYGETWSNIELPDNSGAYSVIKYHSGDENTIYTTHYTSRDGGETWVKNDYRILSVNEANNDVLWGTDDNYGVYVSLDKGLTWNLTTQFRNQIKTVHADSGNVSGAWATLHMGDVYYISYEDGQTSYSRVSEIKGLKVNAIEQNPANPNHIIAGGQSLLHTKSNGLYESFDGGSTWRVVTGLPSMGTVFEIKFSPLANEVFISGFTGGIVLYDYNEYTKYLEKSGTDINIEYQDNKARIIFNKLIDNPVLFIAEYSENNTLTKCETVEISEANDGYFEQNIASPSENGQIKLFLWNNKTFEPIAKN